MKRRFIHWMQQESRGCFLINWQRERGKNPSQLGGRFLGKGKARQGTDIQSKLQSKSEIGNSLLLFHLPPPLHSIHIYNTQVYYIHMPRQDKTRDKIRYIINSYVNQMEGWWWSWRRRRRWWFSVRFHLQGDRSVDRYRDKSRNETNEPSVFHTHSFTRDIYI